jgi:hypothetical protein
MNTRNSTIATSVYVLVTVMPRYSRSILSSILQGKPRSGERERGATLRTVCHTPVWCTVKLVPLHHRRKQRVSGAVLPSFPKSKWASLHLNLGH